MTDHLRLIEVAFPLKQASLDSVHEKNVRHGHISKLHIWPGRRPLAAYRATLIATLLPDPGNAEERKKLLEKLGGRIVQVVKRKKLPNGKIEEKIAEETVGGILHWGRESSPDLNQTTGDSYTTVTPCAASTLVSPGESRNGFPIMLAESLSAR